MLDIRKIINYNQDKLMNRREVLRSGNALFKDKGEKQLKNLKKRK